MKDLKIPLYQGECLITIIPSNDSSIFETIDEAEAKKWGEASCQINEAGIYEYLIQEGYFLIEVPGIVTTSKLNKQSGRITPNIFVGTLNLKIIATTTGQVAGSFNLEVRSVKAKYRTHYRSMLEEIAEKCSDLLMQHSSPVVQSFTPDLEKDSLTSYQRFSFIKSLLESEDFESALHKIISSPTTKWKNSLADKSIQSVLRFDRQAIRQLSSSNNRIEINEDHPLGKIFRSLPSKIQVSIKEETVDTPENRFIQFALDEFLKHCTEFSCVKNNSRLKEEATFLEEKLQSYLSNALFKELTPLSSIPINNPVLQRKEGYREIYKCWLLFYLAAKLTWDGGEDIYQGNKRDVAVLYEYWVFFKMIDLVAEVFDFDLPLADTLIEETKDGFGLKIKQGRFLPIKGVSEKGSRKLHVQLSYNRTYKGDQSYPDAGSWSRNLRPDYTLTIWPFGIEENQAELEESIVHIHFDAKYKVEKLKEIFSNDVHLDSEKEEERKGTYQRGDLLKMHAYRDAIRRTAGVYILYPGDDQPKIKRGFHELIPGLGAFAIRPTRTNNGMEELRIFFNDILNHLLNRTSQREKIALKTFQVYKDEPTSNFREGIPEAIGSNRTLIPDETFVLVGYYKSEEQYNWIVKNNLYNFRTGSGNGSLILDKETVSSKYLLLHTKGDSSSSELWKIISEGPQVYSKDDMLKIDYPSPSHDYYLIIKIEKVNDTEFKDEKWNFKALKKYLPFRASSRPFTSNLTELMQCKHDLN